MATTGVPSLESSLSFNAVVENTRCLTCVSYAILNASTFGAADPSAASSARRTISAENTYFPKYADYLRLARPMIERLSDLTGFCAIVGQREDDWSRHFDQVKDCAKNDPCRSGLASLGA